MIARESYYCIKCRGRHYEGSINYLKHQNWKGNKSSKAKCLRLREVGRCPVTLSCGMTCSLKDRISGHKTLPKAMTPSKKEIKEAVAKTGDEKLGIWNAWTNRLRSYCEQAVLRFTDRKGNLLSLRWTRMGFQIKEIEEDEDGNEIDREYRDASPFELGIAFKAMRERRARIASLPLEANRSLLKIEKKERLLSFLFLDKNLLKIIVKI